MFRIQEITAAGTFGTVCVAHEVERDRTVALKVLKEEFLENPKVLSRTRDEARMLAKIDHPNVVKVEDLIDLDGRPVVVMEWVRGTSLEDLIGAHPEGMPLAEALEITRQTFLGLQAAHETLGIVHRDIKPSNVLLGLDGQVKVVDFGIAHGKFEGKEAETVSMVLGARAYLSPERLDGSADHPAGDVYSVGLVMFELLTGQRMVLSMHPLHHTRQMAEGLQHVYPDWELDQRAPLVELIQSFCNYFADNRPDHGEAAKRIGILMKRLGATPNLGAFATAQVAPIFDQRARIPPKQHHHWPDLAFLEAREDFVTQEVAPAAAFAAASASPQPLGGGSADDVVRGFIGQRHWERRMPELKAILRKHPDWTAEPFLEVLDEALVPTWKFWRKTYVSPDKVLAALDVLRERPGPAVSTRAQQLLSHKDSRVARRAKSLA